MQEDTSYTRPSTLPKLPEALTYIKKQIECILCVIHDSPPQTSFYTQTPKDNIYTIVQKLLSILLKEVAILKLENEELHLQLDPDDTTNTTTTTPIDHKLILDALSKAKHETSNATTIKHIKKHLHIEYLHSDEIWALTSIGNNDHKRIATSSKDGSICICTIDYLTHKWSCDIKKESAHDAGIPSLCELPNERIVSCSDDYTIKIWNVSQYELTHLQTLPTQNDYLAKVHYLPNDKFISCSLDSSIIIWNSNEPYDVHTTFNEDEQGRSWDVINLSKGEIVVTSCSTSSAKNYISFWDVCEKKKMHSITVNGVYKCCGLVEVCTSGNKSDEVGYIAVCLSKYKGTYIAVVDVRDYCVVKEIWDKDVITDASMLKAVGKESLVYVANGGLMQVSTRSWDVVYKGKGLYGVKGNAGGVVVKDGEYIVTNNESEGISVIKIEW